ncbi:MAG TPA: ribonuclease R [Burkholderiales bacterium]
MSTHDDGPPPDPMAEREAARYEFPVPSREAVLALLAERGNPMSFDDITEALGVEGERDREAFARRLRAMERDGQLYRNRRSLYGLPQKMDLVRGRVVAHPDGFGFLVPEDGSADLFLPPRELRIALHGDRVLARVTGIDARGRRTGALVEVLERARRTVVGRYIASEGVGFVAPSDKRITQDIAIPAGAEGGARDNQIVVAEIVQPPTYRTGPVGRVVEVLGDHMAPGMEIEVAIRAHDIPHKWPAEALEEAGRFPAEVPAEAYHGREDLRELPLVTIDGEDARDFDDAVYAERQGRGWRLIVAIADVSHYVRPGSALDREALRRGNSVYFPQQVVPMLPEVLSNVLCSLNPQVDRLCMACEIAIGARGEIKKYRFFEAVMRSAARLTYTTVARLLVERDARLRKEHQALVPALENLYGVYRVLYAARLRRGAVDFELPETRIVYDENRKIERVVPLERTDAHRLIEECMLAANVCAADLLRKHKVPAPYRVHEGPTEEKLAELREFLFELGLTLGGGDSPQAAHYAKLLNAIAGRPDARLIQTVLLRSLSQAMYSVDNVGHFALGYEHYTHFTSPIRRYPDLLVHRAIKAILRRERQPFTLVEAREWSDHCSMTERRADEATREVIRWLKAEYMHDKVGEEFDGIISGVTSFGVFVELNEVFVDGLIHIAALGNDYFQFEPGKHRLIGERTRSIYRLGDPIRVKVVRVDIDEARIDFEPVGQPAKLAAGRANLRRRTVRHEKAAARRKARRRR